MSAAVPTLASSARLFANDAIAGCLTAGVFYAEYISLGATFSQALPGNSAKALGGVMVIGAVIACCLVAIFLRQSVLAGPRAASLAVLISGMSLASSQVTQLEAKKSAALVALLVILSVAAMVQLAGLDKKVQTFVENSSVPLRKGFMFATATAIVVGLSARQLDGCLKVNPFATVIIFSISVASALAWSWLCSAVHSRATWLGKLGSMSMLVGVAVATGGYYFFMATGASNGQCATIGSAGFEWSYITQLAISPKALQDSWVHVPGWVWPLLVLMGLLAGAVMLLESFTTLSDKKFAIDNKDWSRYIKFSAGINLLCAPLGLSCSSLSASRTTALREANGQGSASAVWHGVALLFILFALSTWVSKMPIIAVAVALTLVAMQMIDKDMWDGIWSVGLTADAEAGNVKNTWWFLAVFVSSVFAGWLLSMGKLTFSGGAVIALIVCAVVFYSLPVAKASQQTPKL